MHVKIKQNCVSVFTPGAHIRIGDATNIIPTPPKLT